MKNRLLVQELVGKGIRIRPFDCQTFKRSQLGIKTRNDVIGRAISFDVVQHLQDIVGATLRVIFRVVYTSIPTIRRLIADTRCGSLHIGIEIVIRFCLQQP